MTILIHDVDIKLLRVFYTIVQCGGFSLAQARLNVSQSSISTQMSKLETRLGFRLCERGHGIFRLTPEGEHVLKATERLLAALDDFSSELLESQKKPAGDLRIGLMDNMVSNPNSPLSNVLADVAEDAPDIHFNIHIGSVADLGERVLDSRLHLAISFSYRPIAGLSYTPLFTEEHQLYCGRAHPFFDRDDRTITIEELLEAKYAGWGNSAAIPDDDMPVAFTEVASSHNMEGLVYLVQSGHFVAFLPSHYAKRWVEKGEMRAVRPDILSHSVQFYLMLRDNDCHPLVVRCFLDYLANYISQQELSRAVG
ncbi:LysR family transcriptional regulator [Emcibacter nanhaiensis]|uniref:LysR family transcriptional regulator n=1 Tax=Emcibacter nanhaiensis TaxID=1505037 RepID=A0A501PI95_9PROT|nr:LysR family transcriptional regulator [Emcibacter nanhaiensis]TPD60190.1 LysR family transcriptional regulator [Emcibacter nanhaiensis]